MHTSTWTILIYYEMIAMVIVIGMHFFRFPWRGNVTIFFVFINAVLSQVGQRSYNIFHLE